MSDEPGRHDGPQLEQLVRRARAELRDWTDHTDSDPGVALVELLAYVGDLLSSYQDKVADEAHLDSGRRGSSRRAAVDVEERGRRWRRVADDADVADAADVADSDGRVCGVHAGVVLDNTDPLMRRRLLVRVPDVTGEALWAMACLPVPGTPGTPALGDAVWVAFESGDPSRPVWLGRRVT